MAIKINKDIQISDTGVSLENLQKYSTSETRIGTWINGKPLYRIVLGNYFSQTYYNWYTIGYVSYVDELVSVNGAIKLQGSNDFVNFPRATANDGSIDFYLASNGGVNIRINAAPGQLYIILEYTKTTD